MYKPIKVVDIELSYPLADIQGLCGYGALQGLIRFHGVPLGFITIQVTGAKCLAADLQHAILDQYTKAILSHLVENWLAAPHTGPLRLEDLVDIPLPNEEGPFPFVTVAVCTRDRTEDLAVCLESLNKLDYPNLEILIVDNTPTSSATRQLVTVGYPHFRYVCESRPGLDWARNRAIREGRGEIIAFTDDDVVVDPQWVASLAKIFWENAEVMAVTGLVVPYELETRAQILFEKYGGFGRGFQRKWYRVCARDGESAARLHAWAGKFGTGANMAFRRSLFDQIGFFDTALDVGTVTNGGGDMEMFFRVIQEGYPLVYEPSALVRHRHRADLNSLKKQITNNGVGFSAYLVRCTLAYPSESLFLLFFWFYWLFKWYIFRWLNSLRGKETFPGYLILSELSGFLSGLFRYPLARRRAGKIEKEYRRAIANSLPVEFSTK